MITRLGRTIPAFCFEGLPTILLSFGQRQYSQLYDQSAWLNNSKMELSERIKRETEMWRHQ